MKPSHSKSVLNVFALLALMFSMLPAYSAKAEAGSLQVSGDFGWAESVGGTDAEYGKSISADLTGNVYTVGSFQGTIDFDPGINSYNLTSAGYQDIFITKYDPEGNFLWAKSIGGISSDFINAIAVDAGGNVYLAGEFREIVDFDPGAGVFNLTSTDYGIDIFVSKLDTDGNFLWAKSMGGTEYDFATDITLDANNNILVAGNFRGSGVDFDPGVDTFNLNSVGASDIFISKLDIDGNFNWAVSMGGWGSDYCWGIDTDSNDNVYTLGSYEGTADFDPGIDTFNLTDDGGFISRLNSAGNFVWAKKSGPGKDIVLDVNDNVYTTGYFGGVVDFDPGMGIFNLESTSQSYSDIFVSKLDNDGDFVWAKNMGGISSDFGNAISTDTNGDVYTIGSFAGTADFDPGTGERNLTGSGGVDVYISKLDSNGNFVWANNIGGEYNYNDNYSDDGNSIAIDTNNNIYATGCYAGTADFDPGSGAANLTSNAATADIFIYKINNDGVAPLITSFEADSFSTSRYIPIESFTASDNRELDGFAITTSATQPEVGEVGWFYDAPAGYLVEGDGDYTLYPWVKDIQGNISSVFAAPVNVTVNTSTRTTGILFAKPDASEVGDCSSWANACTLQNALTNATIGEEIWAMSGTHKPATVGTDREATFQLKNGVDVYGGFDGTETDRIHRDYAANVTILSGDIDNNDSQTPIIDLYTVTGNTTNSQHVVTGATGAILDGFTITAGYGTLGSGSGMFNQSSNPMLTNIIFTGNWVYYGGGGMYNQDSSPTLTKITFSGNWAGSGGGMYNEQGSSPLLTNVTFNDNSGGGMFNDFSNPTLVNVTFSSNSASSGGGMNNWYSSPTLTNVTFSDNSASNEGGGMANSFSDPTLTNVTFSNNLGNIYGWGGGGMFNWGSNPQIHNALFWGNTATQIYTRSDSPGNPAIYDSIIQGGCPDGSICTNIISTDPLLGPLGNYGGFTPTVPLLAGSSAIDAGNDGTCAETDQRGVPRPQGDHCDIGAYEEAAPVAVSITRVDPSPTRLASVSFIVTFSELVTGVDMVGPTFDDFILTTSSSISGASVLSVNGSGAIFTVTVNTGSGDGLLRLDVGTGGQIMDGDFNPLTTDFTAGETYDVIKTITIEPKLAWNTFLGGNGYDSQYSIAVDKNSNVYVTGTSNDETWGTPIRTFSGGLEAYVAKLSPSGELIWNTFLGGSKVDAGQGIFVDKDGNVYVTGLSYTTWGNPIRAHSGDSEGMGDVFVAKISPSGSLIWNTFLGSKSPDFSASITVDANGNVYAAGGSYATWGSPVRAFSGLYDAFAAKLSSSGSLVWNTFLGSADNDYPYSSAVDRDGNLYLGGTSNATWGSPVRAYSGTVDGFVAKLSSSGSLSWNTFLGNSDYDDLRSVVVDGSDNVYVAGASPSSWGSPVRAYSGEIDAYIAKLGHSGSLIWNTFLGGSNFDYGFSLAANGTGNLYVLGESYGTWGDPVQPYFGGFRDGFTAKIDPSGNLTWSTFIGGSGDDQVRSLFLDQNENIHIAGFSDATWGAPIRAYTANTDGFVAVMRDHTFADVSTSHWAWDFIERLYANGITGGCGGSNYCPNSTVTREQMAVFLLVAEHGTGYTPSPATGIFADVPAADPFAPWIEQLAAEGITGGCGGGNYCPKQAVTREQMAVFLLVAEHGTGYTPPSATGIFNDVPTNNVFAPWIEQLASEGITGGCGGGNYCPRTTINRGQMAVFLVTAFDLP